MINLRSAFPTAREKNRRTARGKKPEQYVANAPSLSALYHKMFENVLVEHNECHRGYRRHWFLIHDTVKNLYGYSTVHEHERIPFEASCNSLAAINNICLIIEQQVQWYPNVVDLVKMVATGPNRFGIKTGTNIDFIEMVKQKFPEQFAPPPEPKPVTKYSPYYWFDKKPLRSSWDEDQFRYDYDYDTNFYRR